MNKETMMEMLVDLLYVNDASDKMINGTISLADENPEIRSLSAQMCRIKDVIRQLVISLKDPEEMIPDPGWFYNALSRDMEPEEKILLLLEGPKTQEEDD